jgi:hypothetical protein
MKPRGTSLVLTAHRIKVKRAVFNEIATSGEDTQPPSLAIPQRIHARRRRPPISCASWRPPDLRQENFCR